MTPLKELDAWVLEFRPPGEAELWDIVGRIVAHEGKLASYLQQENEVLIERVRLLEIALAVEREACAKVAEGWGYTDEAKNSTWFSGEAAMHFASQSIASLIRARGER